MTIGAIDLAWLFVALGGAFGIIPGAGAAAWPCILVAGILGLVIGG